VKRGQDKQLSSKLGHCFKQIDLYGEQVTLTYKGYSKFKTFYGAIGTILLIATILGYGSSKFKTLINRASPKITRSTFQRDLAQQDTV